MPITFSMLLCQLFIMHADITDSIFNRKYHWKVLYLHNAYIICSVWCVKLYYDFLFWSQKIVLDRDKHLSVLLILNYFLECLPLLHKKSTSTKYVLDGSTNHNITFCMRYLASSMTEISNVVPMLYVNPGEPRCRMTSNASTTSDTYKKFRVTLPSPWI